MLKLISNVLIYIFFQGNGENQANPSINLQHQMSRLPPQMNNMQQSAEKLKFLQMQQVRRIVNLYLPRLFFNHANSNRSICRINNSKKSCRRC